MSQHSLNTSVCSSWSSTLKVSQREREGAGRVPRRGSREDRDRARSRRARWARAVQGPSDVSGRRAQRDRACRARPGADTGAERMGARGKDATRVVYCHNMYKHDAIQRPPKRDGHDTFRQKVIWSHLSSGRRLKTEDVRRTSGGSVLPSQQIPGLESFIDKDCSFTNSCVLEPGSTSTGRRE
jgi:hypothetical protein